MKFSKMLLILSLLTLLLHGCGGGGGGSSTTPQILYGNIDGYVYVAIGSQPVARMAESAQPGYKPLDGANVSIVCGTTTKNTTSDSNGYFKVNTLPSGGCTVSISKSGYAVTQTSVTVSANTTKTVGGANGSILSPAVSGSIRVNANVAGGEVSIDGTKTGITIPASLNYTFASISVGNHIVKIELAGYQPPSQQTVNVTSGVTAQVTFTFGAPDNTPPVANAGADGKTFVSKYYTYQYQYGDTRDYTVHDNSYTLDGSGSYDSGGGTITYSWTQTGGPATVVLSSTTASKPTFIPTTEGTYTFQLIVRDGAENLSNPDSVSVYTAHVSGKLTFSTYFVGTDEISVINADGTVFTRLTNNIYYDLSPHWSVNGQKIYFATNPSNDDSTYYLAKMNVDGSNVSLMNSGSFIEDMSPDGNKILYMPTIAVNSDYYIVGSDGTNPHQFTTTGRTKGFAEYSADGTKIVFSQAMGGDNYQIFIMNTDGTNITQITNDTKVHFYVAWAADGRILYTAATALGQAHVLYVMNMNGTNQQIWPVPTGISSVKMPRMTSDGKYIFYKDSDSILHVMYADGSADLNLGLSVANYDYYSGQ